MNRENNQIYFASKRERLLAVTIFLLILTSFFLHLCAFADIFFKNYEYRNNQTEIKKNNLTNKNFNDSLNINLLPLFCLIAQLIWTIVPIVILDPCCITNNKSIYKILLKLFLCTCPLLFCNELNIVFVCHMKDLRNDLLIISIKWLIFIGTIFISFWTGIISDRNKWLGIHGGQIAPEHHSPLYLFDN